MAEFLVFMPPGEEGTVHGAIASALAVVRQMTR
jgi:hypothetical protein